MTTSTVQMNALIGATIHPAWMRTSHWINVLAAVVLMVASGWRIYNAAPRVEFRFPGEITLGGWLGGALQWHFAGMWLLVLNGLIYLALNVFSGRLARKFFPLTFAVVWHDFRDALHGRLSHADPRHYNGLQRLAYLFAIADLALLVLSGLALWKSMQKSVPPRGLWRLRGGASRAFLCDGGTDCVRRRTPGDGSASAQNPARDDSRSARGTHDEDHEAFSRWARRWRRAPSRRR